MPDGPKRAEAFEQRLPPDERLVWSGAPLGGVSLRASDIFLIPFSLLWGGFAVFWNVLVWLTPAPAEMRLFGLPFVLLGLYFIVGRFWMDAWLRTRTRYAVTTRRVLIARQGPWPVFKSLDLRRLPALELRERKDGSGTIQFGASASPFGWGGMGLWSPALDPTPQFSRVAGVRHVYDLILRTSDQPEGGAA